MTDLRYVEIYTYYIYLSMDDWFKVCRDIHIPYIFEYGCDIKIQKSMVTWSNTKLDEYLNQTLYKVQSSSTLQSEAHPVSYASI